MFNVSRAARVGPYAVAASLAVGAVPQVLEGDWPFAVQIGVAALYIAASAALGEGRRVSEYRTGYSRGVITGLEALMDLRQKQRIDIPSSDKVHPDDGWRP